MRTTIDLPADLHHQATSIARDTSRTLSETVADLLREALGQTGQAPRRITQDQETGLPLVRVGRPVTTEEVRALDDDQ